ncbi:MAG TPA: hypothetical protein ENH00_08765 [Actinobacteria bacterium]|nr:hypothetical protein [Actinomycetota bacterium]
MRMRQALRALWARPWLWGEALAYLGATRSRHGLDPRPDAEYMRWRSATAYGDPDRVPGADDLRAVIAWRRRWRRSVGR